MISLGISLPKQLFLMIPRMYFVSATFIFNCRNNTPLILIWMSVHHQRLRTILHLQPSDKRWAKTNWCKLILISRDVSASERRMACGFRGREEDFDCTDAAAVRRHLHAKFTEDQKPLTDRSIVSSWAVAARRTVIASTLCFLLHARSWWADKRCILDDDAVPRVETLAWTVTNRSAQNVQ